MRKSLKTIIVICIIIVVFVAAFVFMKLGLEHMLEWLLRSLTGKSL